jgi:nucleoid DNA-binding protein
MELQVYISQLKDEEFDYNIEYPIGNRQYAPKPIYWGYRLVDLFKDIVHKVLDHDENTKQTDWGTFVIKFTKTDLMEYLLKYVVMYEKDLEKMSENFFKEIYKQNTLGGVNTLLNQTKKLPDGEYLLVAQELF